MNWAEKYRPARLEEIVGNAAAVRQIAAWAQDWTSRSRPLLIYGKPGTGKTSSAHALARDMGWEVIELNASDQRTASVIEQVAGTASRTASITTSVRKLIVLDEADNLQGTADRGGARAILACIRGAQQPVILIANDLYGIPAEIRLRCDPVQFRAIPARSIAPRLRYICASEKITCSEAAVLAIAENAGGDIRAAVNMLHAAAIGRDRIGETPASRKDERVSIFSLITAVFNPTPDPELMRLSYAQDDTPDTVEQWIEGNLPLLHSAEAMAEGYRYLARADEYLGYTFRRQYHTLWRYATALMLLGVADAAGGRGIHARIMPPERWQKLSAARKQKAIRGSTLARFADLLHIPRSTLGERYLDIISLLVEHDPAAYAAELTLDADQLNFFLHDKARAQEIIKEVLRNEKAQAGARKQPAPKKSAQPERQQETEPPLPPEPAAKKQPTRTQSTLFDGF